MTDARDIARQLIEGNATDIEFGDIGDYISGLDGAAADTEAEFDQLQKKVDDLIGKANVTVTWADEQAEGEDPIYPAPGSAIPDQPGYVVGECEHRVAASEWRAGFRTCERCPAESEDDEDEGDCRPPEERDTLEDQQEPGTS